jgi:hypothetical protein
MAASMTVRQSGDGLGSSGDRTTPDAPPATSEIRTAPAIAAVASFFGRLSRSVGSRPASGGFGRQ